jgi:hypothetical protein
MDVAEFGTRSRTPVERDFRGDIVHINEYENPTRMLGQLYTLARIIVWMWGPEKGEARAKYITNRIVFDSIPINRMKVLKVAAKYDRVTLGGLSQVVGVSPTVISYWCEDLTALKVLKKTKHAGTSKDMFALNKGDRDILCSHFDITPLNSILDNTEEESEVFESIGMGSSVDMSPEDFVESLKQL